jgi:hypothetical protein
VLIIAFIVLTKCVGINCKLYVTQDSQYCKYPCTSVQLTNTVDQLSILQLSDATSRFVTFFIITLWRLIPCARGHFSSQQFRNRAAPPRPKVVASTTGHGRGTRFYNSYLHIEWILNSYWLGQMQSTIIKLFNVPYYGANCIGHAADLCCVLKAGPSASAILATHSLYLSLSLYLSYFLSFFLSFSLSLFPSLSLALALPLSFFLNLSGLPSIWANLAFNLTAVFLLQEIESQDVMSSFAK